MTLEVFEERCSQCLFSPNKLVNDARRKQLLEECQKDEGFFICHKSSLGGGTVCCKGFYDLQGTERVREAKTTGEVKFVPIPNDDEVQRKYMQRLLTNWV